jgi:hypothetical protein
MHTLKHSAEYLKEVFRWSVLFPLYKIYVSNKSPEQYTEHSLCYSHINIVTCLVKRQVIMGSGLDESIYWTFTCRNYN